MTATNINSRSYKAAIALSNTGVSLLERGSFADALATHKDALDLVRSALPPTGSAYNNTYPEEIWEKHLNHLLHQGSRRLAQSNIKDDMSLTISSLPFDLSVLLDNHCHESISQALFTMSMTSHVFAVRIDDSSKCSDDLDTFDVDTAIILMNYGIACRCQGPMLLRSSYKFLHLAYVVLTRESNFLLSSVDEVEAIRVLFVSILVVRNLLQLCNDLNQPRKAEYYHQKLIRLKEAFFRIQKMPGMITAVKTSAPAA